MFQEPDDTTLLGRLSLRTKRVPAAIRVPLLLLALGATAICIIADIGPYRWFAEAQASVMDGEHVLILSILLTMLVFVTPMGIFLHLIAGSFKDNRPDYLRPPSPYPTNAGPPPAYMQDGPYAHPVHGQGPQGQPPYGQPPYGQAPYGQAPYGQAPYGQAPYGQAPYGQAPTGQAPTGSTK